MTHFFSFLNIASHKCGYILSNKTHIVTVHYATKTKNSSQKPPPASFVTASSPKTKTLVPLTRPGQSEGSSPPSGSPGSTGTWHGGNRCGASGGAGGFIINPATHVNFIKKSRAGSGHRRSRDLPRGMEFQLPWSSLCQHQGSWARWRTGGGISSWGMLWIPHLTPRHTSSSSLHHQAWAFLLRKAQPHLAQPQKCPKLPQKHKGGTWWEEHGLELGGFHGNWDPVSAPSCLSCRRLSCVILCAAFSFTECSSSPAVQVR